MSPWCSMRYNSSDGSNESMPATSGSSSAPGDRRTAYGSIGGCDTNWLPSVSAQIGMVRGARYVGRRDRRGIQDAVRAVQGDPPTAVLDPGADGPLLVERRSQVARVGDEEVRRGDGADVAEVLGDADRTWSSVASSFSSSRRAKSKSWYLPPQTR